VPCCRDPQPSSRWYVDPGVARIRPSPEEDLAPWDRVSGSLSGGLHSPCKSMPGSTDRAEAAAWSAGTSMTTLEDAPGEKCSRPSHHRMSSRCPSPQATTAVPWPLTKNTVAPAGVAHQGETRLGGRELRLVTCSVTGPVSVFVFWVSWKCQAWMWSHTVAQCAMARAMTTASPTTITPSASRLPRRFITSRPGRG